MDVEGRSPFVEQGEQDQDAQAQAEERQGVERATLTGDCSGNDQAGSDVHAKFRRCRSYILILDDFALQLEAVQHQPVGDQPHQVQRDDSGQ